MTGGTSRTDQELQLLDERADELEAELVRILEQRAQVARKQRVLLEGEPPREVDEGEWLRRLEGQAGGQLPAESLRAILRELRAALRGIELPGRIAFVGPQGGLCHQMVRRHFGAGSPTLECPGVVEALDAVARGRAVTAAIPLESSAEGLAQSSVTALARSELVIVGERSLSYAFDLVALDPERPIERLFVTPAARVACRGTLAERFSTVELVEAPSPLECLERAEHDRHGAAIVLHDCARESAFVVLQNNVGDTPDAFVRFALVAARPAKRSEWNRTCLLFGVQDEPGSLFEVLRHFAERGLNLGRVQSRPLPQAALFRGKGWDYAFYLEVDGHESDRSMVAALDRVRRATKYVRVLGSYPVDEPPG